MTWTWTCLVKMGWWWWQLALCAYFSCHMRSTKARSNLSWSLCSGKWWANGCVMGSWSCNLSTSVHIKPTWLTPSLCGFLSHCTALAVMTFDYHDDDDCHDRGGCFFVTSSLYNCEVVFNVKNEYKDADGLNDLIITTRSDFKHVLLMLKQW